MSNDGRRRGTITVEHAPEHRDLHRFVIVDERGDVLETSAGFTEADARPALDAFLAALKRNGWMVTKSPDTRAGADWYRYALTDYGSRPVAVPEVRERSTPVTKLWIATLVVIVVLFVICVALAFTTQIEIRPG